MQTINPNSSLILWIVYVEDSVIVSGLLDLKIIVFDKDQNIILPQTTLIESSVQAGHYSYTLDISNIAQENTLFVYYYKGSFLLDVEEYFINIESDDIGRAF